MIIYLLYAIAIGFILTCLTAKAKKLSGYLALLCILLFNVIIFNIAIATFKSSAPLSMPNTLFSLPAIGANLLFSVDKLSAIFLILIGLVSLLATLYSIDYMNSYPEKNMLRFYPMLIIFVASMIGVVCVADLFFFFVFWELMTLASYVLVVFEKEERVVLRAGFKYFLMTHVATALMFIAGVILRANSGSFSFAASSQALTNMAAASPIAFHIILALFFIGFATKAGVFPFGTWLPDAHPAAPSGISAILSGIMIKMGIYGMLRIFLYWVPAADSPLAVWGIIIASFGVLSIIVGTLGALVQEDYKRLFAYSSIGQIGYILLAIGIGISFAKSQPALAIIAIVAGLFHLCNHAFFKSLLFLNAGSVLYTTGTRNLTQVGGLHSILPLTTLTAMIGSMSIIGFPLFSGFISKFMIFESSIIGGVKLSLYILYGVLAIFMSVLTMAYCVKFLSCSFFGYVPLSLSKKIVKKDVPFTMVLAQLIIAALCVVFGLLPLLAMKPIYSALANAKLTSLLPTFASLFGSGRNGIILLAQGKWIGIFRPFFIFLVFTFCLILTYLLFKSARAMKRNVSVWYCGEEYNADQVRYRANSFYLPFLSFFKGWFLRPTALISFKKPEWFYRTFDFDRLVYSPVGRWMINSLGKLRKTHSGIPQVYMLWQAIGIFLVILVLFLLAR